MALPLRTSYDQNLIAAEDPSKVIHTEDILNKNKGILGDWDLSQLNPFKTNWWGLFGSNQPLSLDDQFKKAFGYSDAQLAAIKSQPFLYNSMLNNMSQMEGINFLRENQGIGWNIPTIQLGFNAIKAFKDWGAADEAADLARDSLDWQKEKYEEQKQIALEDRERALAARRYSQSSFGGGSLVG